MARAKGLAGIKHDFLVTDTKLYSSLARPDPYGTEFKRLKEWKPLGSPILLLYNADLHFFLIRVSWKDVGQGLQVRAEFRFDI
jgi:hypothetical protein